MWDEFGTWEADSSYNQPAVPDSAQTDVLQGTQSAPVGSDMWTGFFQETMKGLVQYATVKDVAQTKAGIAAQQQQMQMQQNQAAYRAAAFTQQQGGSGLLMLLLIGGVVFMAVND